MPLKITPVSEVKPDAWDRARADEAITIARLAKRLELMHGEVIENLAAFDRRLTALEVRAMATGAAGGAVAALLGALAQWGGQ